VRNLSAGSDDLVLCKAVIVMAHALGLKVAAEGIESREQCQLLTVAGCDYRSRPPDFQAGAGRRVRDVARSASDGVRVSSCHALERAYP
jgi:hypothetical protein